MVERAETTRECESMKSIDNKKAQDFGEQGFFEIASLNTKELNL